MCSTASACKNPSDSITEIVRLDYYNQKQNEVLYVNMENMDLLPPTAPSLVFACETHRPYCCCGWGFSTRSRQTFYICCKTCSLHCIPRQSENHVNVGPVSVWDIKQPLRPTSTLTAKGYVIEAHSIYTGQLA